MTEYIVEYLPKTKQLVADLPDGIAETGLGLLFVKLDKLPWKNVRILEVFTNHCKVLADDYGYTLLRLEFGRDYYNIMKEKNELAGN